MKQWRLDYGVESLSLNYFRALYYLYGGMRSAYWDKDKLDRYQNKKLRHLIRYAYENVQFYHDRLRELEIRPDDVMGTSDLKKLPIIRKDEIRRNPEAFVSREFDVSKLKRLCTSGSTGQPLCLWISRSEDEFRKARHLRTVISCGQRPGDRWVIITSPKHFGTSTRLQRIVNFFVPRPVSVFDDLDTQISVIGKIGPDVLDGYSSSLFLLAKEVEKRKVRAIAPRFVLGGAELVDDASRRCVEDVFAVPFYDHYSCVEFDSVSWQCPEKSGYHMDVDSLVLQFVDEGEEVSAGETGEIICTSLFNYAMPFIRYAIGDIGVRSDEECACGRTLPLMKMIEGRRDSLLTLPDGRLISPRTFAVAMSMFERYGDFDQFRVVQKRVDLFRIYLKMKEAGINRESVSRDLIEHLRKVVFKGADSVTFEVEFVDDIHVDKTGKFIMVASDLSKKTSVRLD